MTLATPPGRRRSVLERIKAAFGETAARFRSRGGDGANSLDQDTMLAFLVSMLQVRARFIEPRISADPGRAALVAEVREALDTFFDAAAADRRPPVQDARWTEAYRLERMLALAEPPGDLLAELRRRVAEASDGRVGAAGRLSAAVDAAAPLAIDTSTTPPTLRPGGEDILRNLLLATLEELHWTYQRRFFSRPIQKAATYKVVWCGLAAFLLFVLPYAWLHISLLRGGTLALDRWSWLPFYVPLSAGLFGAMFSRLIYLQSNWNLLSLGAIKDARDFTSILLRGAVGVAGAVIVSFFLLSGVIQGDLLPRFGEIGLEQARFPAQVVGDVAQLRLVYPNKALSLLVVWSFLAGFSERLVPNILKSTETSIDRPDNK